jgi:FKBP-type peptidyl-prolyl cis-trans isomerase 2
MRQSHRNKITIVILVILLTWLAIFSQQSVAAESPRVIDGSNVTFLYKITVPGEGGFTVRNISQFVQGKHQLLPALERVVAGMKPGEKKSVQLTPEEGFGPYDAKKKKAIPRAELPTGVKEGDILEDQAGTPATIAELSDTSAVMDYNHPLAGKPLILQITILKVENPA